MFDPTELDKVSNRIRPTSKVSGVPGDSFEAADRATTTARNWVGADAHGTGSIGASLPSMWRTTALALSNASEPRQETATHRDLAIRNR